MPMDDPEDEAKQEDLGLGDSPTADAGDGGGLEPGGQIGPYRL